MKHPKDDLPTRTLVWDSLQMLFMDTDPALLLEDMADVCSKSPYALKEIEEILFNEVLPACRFNMFRLPAPEWRGFETTWLVRRILRKHRFGRRRPLLLRRHTKQWWERLAPMISARRAATGAE